MQHRKTRKTARASSVSKPGAFSLLLHIIRGAFSDGMLFPALVCIGLAATLYYQKLPYYQTLTALLIGSLVILALLRGCARWQQELGKYRREIAMLRHHEQQQEANRGQAIPGFIPFTRR